MTDARPATLDDMIADDLGVWLWCNTCHYHRSMDPSALARKLGGDFPVPEVGRRARCGSCGSRNVESRPDWTSRSIGVVTRHTPDEDG